jgi:hypothetical protein
LWDILDGGDAFVVLQGVLQDKNPMTTGTALVRSAASTCTDTANTGGVNANGATSCLTTASTTSDSVILTTETYAVSEGDNDAKGSGTQMGCSTLTFSLVGTSTVEQRVTLAIILLFVGLFCAWLAYYMYNRYQASKPHQTTYRYLNNWQNVGAAELAASAPKDGIELKANPSSSTPKSISAYTAGKNVASESPSSPSGTSSPPPRSPSPLLGRMPARSPGAAQSGAAPGPAGPKPLRVTSAKRQRPKPQDMY